MSFRRALMLVELDEDVAPAMTALTHVAPKVEHVLLVARLPVATFAWLAGSSRSEPDAATLAAVEAIRAAAASIAGDRAVRVQLAPALGVAALVELGHVERVDLFVAGSRSRRSVAVLADAAKLLDVPLLWPSGSSLRAVHEVACVALVPADGALIAAFLRDHGDPTHHVTVLSREAPIEDLDVILEVAGIGAEVEVPELSFDLWLDTVTKGHAIDLLVLIHVPVALLTSAPWPAPVLVLPTRPVSRSAISIDVADVLYDGGPLRARVDAPATAFDLPPVVDAEIAFVAAGRVVGTLRTSPAGEVELPAGLDANWLGVYRVHPEVSPEPIAAIEQRITIVRPTSTPLVLYEAELSEAALRALAVRAEADGHELLAVRMRPTRSCRSIRERLRAMDLPVRVVDARAVLDEGEALDISPALDAVRLSRVAAKLRASGFLVAEPAAAPVHPIIPGNRVAIELDNAEARALLLDGIARSALSVHLQLYMALDDDVGRAVGDALAAAAARGVRVRVLVDSLHGLHGSFGTSNPFFARLATHPGVEVRISRPITDLPTLADLKQRDHRKLVVIDGNVALVGGRNLSHEYYTGFADMRLTPRASWREVPWLDAGARIEGPAVAAIESAFLEAWTQAGGAEFPVLTPEPLGETAARVVVHHGLRDACTLDVYRSLIDEARAHVYVINGFPLALELQHALVRAVRRGVRVKQLVGHLTPTHGDEPFSGPWGSARTVATDFVHSRSDALVEAGADVFHYAVRDLPGWDEGLGPVHPHVHAKLLSVDGEKASVGSANLDITSAYWESELIVVVEDGALVRGLERRIETLLTGSVRIDREDPAWRELARRRAWMRHWPGVLGV